MNIRFDQVKSYTNGKAGLITGLCEQIGLGQIFDEHLTQPSGRPAEIPYGILAQIMLVNIADDHHPLSMPTDCFQNVDLEALFNMSIDLEKLNDEHLVVFLI